MRSDISVDISVAKLLYSLHRLDKAKRENASFETVQDWTVRVNDYANLVHARVTQFALNFLGE